MCRMREVVRMMVETELDRSKRSNSLKKCVS